MKFGKLMTFTVKLLIICAVSVGLAVAFNTARSKPYTFAELSNPQPPGIVEITTAEMVKFFDSGRYSLVDARSDMDFGMGHIPGAVNIPSWAIGDELSEQVNLLEMSLPVVVYCDGLSCGKSMIVAKKLQEKGFRDVFVYTGGIDGWIGAGKDLEAN